MTWQEIAAPRKSRIKSGDPGRWRTAPRRLGPVGHWNPAVMNLRSTHTVALARAPPGAVLTASMVQETAPRSALKVPRIQSSAKISRRSKGGQ